MRTLISTAVLAAALVLMAASVYGQTERASEVISSGVTRASSPAVNLEGTAGETTVFAMNGTATSVNSGFWPAIYLSELTTTAKPGAPAEELPENYKLEPAYPNPFNPVTRVPYILPKASRVTLAVYDALGQRVALLVDSQKQAGHHEALFRAGQLPSGTYYYRMRAGSYQEVRAVTLLK